MSKKQSPITLYNGDCLELMKNIPDKSIDMILCDLPYGTTACKWDVIIPFDKLWEQYERIIKDNGAIVLFGSEPFSSQLRISNLKLYRYDWIWEKEKGGNPFLVKYQPSKVHEIISVFSKNTHYYYPIKTKLKKTRTNGSSSSNTFNLKDKGYKKIYKDKYPTSILKFNKPHSTIVQHPTQKPVGLLEYLIKTYTKENEIVLDNTMGSGSTGVACVNLNRKFVGIEKDKKYFNIAKKRIENV